MSAPTTIDVPQVVAEVRRRLAEAEGEGVYLKVTGENLDDGWLYVAVEPSRPGVRAIDHSDTMARVERALRREGVDNVLLVPRLEDLED